MRFAFLGTAGAIPSAERDTTSLVFAAAAGALLVDCGGSPVQKLCLAGVDPLALRCVLLTHIHPDHAYGLPSLVQNLFLLGRTEELGVFCRPEHVAPLRTLLELFGLWERPGIFPVTLRALDVREGARAFELGPLGVSTSPNDHGTMPNVAVRVDVRAEPRPRGEASGEMGRDVRAEPRPRGEASGEMGRDRAVVYSSDTRPCDAVVALARGADTLIHEATFPERDRGRFGAHSTAAEAGEIAARAGVRRLILAHIEADYHGEVEALAEEARKHFGGVVEIAREFVPYPL
jgi:ribonuclease Z